MALVIEAMAIKKALVGKCAGGLLFSRLVYVHCRRHDE